MFIVWQNVNICIKFCLLIVLHTFLKGFNAFIIYTIYPDVEQSFKRLPPTPESWQISQNTNKKCIIAYLQCFTCLNLYNLPKRSNVYTLGTLFNSQVCRNDEQREILCQYFMMQFVPMLNCSVKHLSVTLSWYLPPVKHIINHIVWHFMRQILCINTNSRDLVSQSLHTGHLSFFLRLIMSHVKHVKIVTLSRQCNLFKQHGQISSLLSSLSS